jgi:EmrB/QacA subfamily drug resistance transporter
MGQLDASIVTLTFRPVRAEFHSTLAGVEWVSLAYFVALIAFLVPVGRLSDAHGRKQLYLYGFIAFTIGSAACGLAPSLILLIAFRVVQAIGAAMLQANSVALVTTSAPQARLRSAFGVQAGAQALGLALGPTVGGVLVSSVGWRWVFFINVPVGALGVISGYYLLPRTRQRSSAERLDWLGVGLLGATTTSLLLGLSAASGLSLPGWVVAGFFVVAVSCAGGFVAHQRRAAHPLIDLVLLQNQVISAGLVGALCGYLVLFGPLVIVPVVLTSRGISDLGAGLVLTALPAGFAVAALGASRLLPRSWSDQRRATLGGVICAGALAGGLVIPLTQAGLAPLLAVIGIGLGIFTPSNNTMIMGSIPGRSSGTGGGLVNMTRGLGTALGVSLVTLALHVGSAGQGIGSGYRLAFAVLLVAALLAIFVSRSETIGGSAAKPPMELT